MDDVESGRPRRILVTGAGSGMGQAVVKELTDSDYDVIALDRNRAALKDLLADIGHKRSIPALEADVTDAPTMEAELERILGPHGALDGLIACAGTHDHASVAEGDPDRWASMLQVNVIGVANCVKYCLPYLLRSECADVIVWGSVSGFVPYTGESLYAASKAAVTHLVQCLRLELIDTSVRICVIHPGIVDTPMTRSVGLNAEEMNIEFLRPEDVARCAAFIMSQPARTNINELVIRPSRQPM